LRAEGGTLSEGYGCHIAMPVHAADIIGAFVEMFFDVNGNRFLILYGSLDPASQVAE